MHCSSEPKGVSAHRGQLTFWKTKQQNPHHLDSSCLMEGVVAQPKPSICGRLRREDRHQFQVSPGFSARHRLKKNTHPQTKQNTKSASKSLPACKMHETRSPFSHSRAAPRWAGHQGWDFSAPLPLPVPKELSRHWERAAVSAGVSSSLVAGWLKTILRFYLGRRETVELEACELAWLDRVTGGVG